MPFIMQDVNKEFMFYDYFYDIIWGAEISKQDQNIIFMLMVARIQNSVDMFNDRINEPTSFSYSSPTLLFNVFNFPCFAPQGILEINT